MLWKSLYLVQMLENTTRKTLNADTSYAVLVRRMLEKGNWANEISFILKAQYTSKKLFKIKFISSQKQPGIPIINLL